MRPEKLVKRVRDELTNTYSPKLNFSDRIGLLGFLSDPLAKISTVALLVGLFSVILLSRYFETVTGTWLLSLHDTMNQDEKRDLLEVAMQAVGQVLHDQQNRIFHNGALRPDRFPSNAYPNWVQWKSHFIAVAAANRWTQVQAINALPVCLYGHALHEFHAAPATLKEAAESEPAPTLQNLFEHLDRALRVLRNDRMGRSEFKALAQRYFAEGLRAQRLQCGDANVCQSERRGAGRAIPREFHRGTVRPRAA